jgi:hypothetical protein
MSAAIRARHFATTSHAMGITTTTRPVPEDFDPPVLRDVLKKQKRKVQPRLITCDKFPIYDDDPLAQSHELLDEYLRLVERRGDNVKPREMIADQPILKTPLAQWPNHVRAILVRALFYWTHAVKRTKILKLEAWTYGGADEQSLYPLSALANALFKAGENLMLTEQDLVDFVDSFLIGGQVGGDVQNYVGIDNVIDAAGKIIARQGLTPTLRDQLRKLRDWRKSHIYYGSREEQARMRLLDDLLGETPPERHAILEAGEAWAEAAIKRVGEAEWKALLKYCGDCDASKPSRKWLKGAKQLIDALGADEFSRCAGEWLTLAAQPRTSPMREDQTVHPYEARYDLYSDKNEAVLKGLSWACAATDNGKLAGPLGALAEWCYKKIPDHGPRSPVVGNACLIALTMLPGNEPRAELSRLKAKVKQPTGRKMIEKALGKSAAAAGLTPDDLEEQAFGTYGLTEVGRGERKVGSFTVETKITGTTKVEQTFTDAKGKSRASVPAELKSNHAADVKELTQAGKDLTKMLPAFRDRLERLPINARSLPLGAWRERYLDQPVLGTMSRRLIWDFVIDPKQTATGIFHNGKLVDTNDKPLAKMDDEKTIVHLWHPSTASTKEVESWRNFLQKQQITQPFKQAHREVYLLTDAERSTRTYSNRFAAHILRQHIFAALCTQRGWKYRLMGTWDGGGDTTPTLLLPRWDLRVEYWLTGGEAEGGGFGSGVASHVFTDQVRFYSRDSAPEPMPLADVPPLVFSEVMRDVDLFVGVASIGNDPNWMDGGDQVGSYWHQYSFGELSQSSETRLEVLKRLIPRLKIADRCSFQGKFLIVRGDIRTYKIHLGSSNIMMEPNDQYLCIVPDRSSTKAGPANVFLPFEGDQTLSIILSKAFLLAEDTKIKDPTITRQIKR